MTDPKQRFSDRVADYIKYRPKYPVEVIDILKKEIHFSNRQVVADIGAGTGFLTELFLNNGNLTYAVEPNGAMRQACAAIYGQYPQLRVTDGAAERTPLGDRSIDLIVTGTAFHWFEPGATKEEFLRIGKPGGHVLLIWNVRKEDAPFTAGYDALLRRHIPEYEALQHRKFDAAAIRDFFSPRQMKTQVLANSQLFNWEGFKGRALSSSYMPKGGALYDKLLCDMHDLFQQHQTNETILFEYDTVMYYTV